MKSTEQILEFLAEQIGHIYFRPLMYGGSAEGVDLLLFHYQHLWALIIEQEQKLDEFRFKIYKELDCGAMGFSTFYKRNHPEAPEHEAVFYVVDQWKKISDGIGIPIPYEKIKNELKNMLTSSNPNKILNAKLFNLL
ncbi:MAG: hypothetical protein EHM45_17985 [Desulfobacteraceae bacterium]|nr:MAG: hypothetical protein EHM45_17985 [Desulfobacteraceae bacterium]